MLAYSRNPNVINPPLPKVSTENLDNMKEKEKIIVSFLSLHPKDGADINTIRREWEKGFLPWI